MEQNNNNSQWYGAGSTYDWYAPNFTASAKTGAQEAPSPAPRRKPRKKRTAMKVTMLVICVLILVAGTALAFSDGGWSFDYHLSGPGFEVSSDDGGDASTQTDLPDDFFDEFDNFGGMLPGTDNGSGTEDEMPDDFRDFFNSYYTMEETIEPSNIQRAETGADVTVELNSAEGRDKLSLQQIYSKLSPSIVGITAHIDEGDGWGTGVVLHSEGYIVTNAHVIAGANSCTVTLWNGRELEALLVGSDSETDLAVLKVEAKGLVPAAFGNSDELSVGDEVAAIGNPLGEDFIGTMTNGIVSAINRNVDYMGTDLDLIQTNASLNEGNSGGALINMYGQVVGITNMKMVNTYGVTIEGIGFAIPSTTVKEIADKLIAGGEVRGRPSIGIVSGTVPQQAMEEYGLPEGLYITEVYEGSDALAKGIQPGDVLTHVNGEKVTTTDQVIAIRDAHEIGDELLMTIYRDGSYFDVAVEIYDSMDIYG